VVAATRLDRALVAGRRHGWWWRPWYCAWTMPAASTKATVPRMPHRWVGPAVGQSCVSNPAARLASVHLAQRAQFADLALAQSNTAQSPRPVTIRRYQPDTRTEMIYQAHWSTQSNQS
jgi:hypothetical protein